MTLWNLDSFSSHLCWCGPLHLAFPDDMVYACANIQQVAEEEEEGDTPHIDTWSNVTVWVDFMVVCNSNKLCDIRERERERDLTIRSEI